MSAATAVDSNHIAGRPRAAPALLVSRSSGEQFQGTWRLVSWNIKKADGELTGSPLGSDPLGWIMYRPEGSMCVALMRPDRPQFASNNLMEATPEEIKACFEGYIGYCGTYEVNDRERLIIHHIELSSFPNLVGTQQKRHFELAGDRLILKTPPLTLLGEAQVHRLVWQRLN
jgi:hypothetical protein